MRRIATSLAVALAIAGCGEPPGLRPHHAYLYVFAGTAPHTGAAAHDSSGAAAGSDFLAVIDADSGSPTYATIVATIPIGASGTMPHHTELAMPAAGRALFANSFMTGKTYRFDFTDPVKPRIAGTIDSVPGLKFPHSFYRLADGNVLATLQFGDKTVQGDPGGLALLTPDGQVLRTASSADPAFPGANIRTYSLDVSEATDRVITTSAPMDTTSTTADVVQLWRLSDLQLLRTLTYPKSTADSTSRYPFEVRFLAGGTSAFLTTYNCGFYYLSGLDGDSARMEPVLALEQPRHNGCGVPLLIGTWWLQPVGHAREFHVYDISVPRRPRRAGVLAADSGFYAHWMSREIGTDRIALTVEGPSPVVRLARFDSTTGVLRWDESFRETPGGPLGVAFDRAEWPHGRGGKALPHGAVFSRPSGARP